MVTCGVLHGYAYRSMTGYIASKRCKRCKGAIYLVTLGLQMVEKFPSTFLLSRSREQAAKNACNISGTFGGHVRVKISKHI